MAAVRVNQMLWPYDVPNGTEVTYMHTTVVVGAVRQPGIERSLTRNKE